MIYGVILTHYINQAMSNYQMTNVFYDITYGTDNNIAYVCQVHVNSH